MSKSDIPFNADDAHAFLPWVIGIMASMAALLLCLGVTLSGWMVDRHAAYSRSFTVTIPASDDDNNAKITAIHDLLQKLPGVTGVIPVTPAKLHDMLKPWFGSGDAVNALPLPAVFDANLANGAQIDYPSLQTKLAAIVPGTEIDGHEHWIASFGQFSAAMRALIGILATIIVGGLALMIIFTSRAALKLHARAVHLLHAIGAEDSYIASQFQYEAFRLALYGSVPGCIAAGLAYWATGLFMTSLKSSMLPALPLTAAHLAMLIMMPFICGGIAWLASRISVLMQLKRVL